MRVAWGDEKAATKLAKHGVSFEEAATVFGAPPSDTFGDPNVLRKNDVSLSSARQKKVECWSWHIRMRVRSFVSAVLVSRLVEKESRMKKVESEVEEDELRPVYDFSRLKGRVRGKYVERYREGTNLVLLEPDVAAAFPDAKAVNEALRTLIKVAENQVSKR
jgi:hypothetical protein